MSVFQRRSLIPCKGYNQYQYAMYVSIPKAPISTMQGFQTILVLNVWQCSKGSHQYQARVSNNISTQCMPVFQRHSLVTCTGFKQYQYSMYVSVPKAIISTMQWFQTKLVLNVCQCSKGTHQYHARVSSNISTQCMSVFQRHSLVTCNVWVSTNILVLNVCQCSKGTHQYHARVSNNISTQCMSVFQRHSLVPCKGFKQYQYSMYVSVPKALISNMLGFQQYQYSMYVSVPKALISTMQGFQTILVLNVCQYSKGTHQYHARVSNNISTQCMSVFQRQSLVTCKGFKQYQYSMYASVPKALISNMHGFQTILVLNVCQCSKGNHQHHAMVSNKIGTQCMPVFQRDSLVPCKGFKQYQYSMYVSVPKGTMQGFQTLVLNVCQCSEGIITMQGFQTILVLNVCQCSKGTHQYHARVSNNISAQCMSVFQRHSLVTCKGFKQYQYSMYVSVPKALISTMQGFKQYQYSMYVSVPKALISTMQGFQTILVLNVCQCSKGTHQYHARVSNNISTQCMPVFQRHSLVPCKGFKQYQYSMYVSVPKALISTMQGFQTILVLNVCSVFQRHSLVTCQGFNQYLYSMYVSVPKALINTMQGFQPILVRNVCQYSKGTHQHHARVSNNISTQCMSVFQRQSLVPCKGFKQYQYSMYASVPKALISNMQGFQTILVLNVCQCSKGNHQHHAMVSNKIGTQCMPVFQRHSLVPCKGFNQYQYSMYVSVPKALISTMQGFQTILVLNVCQCSEGTHYYHARVSNNISTQCMPVFQRDSLVPCKGFKQYQYSMYVSVPKALISTMQGFQTILVLNVCQCSKGTHQYNARLQTILVLNVWQCSKGTHQYHAGVSNNISTQ